MPIHEVIIQSECERYCPAVEPIMGVQACGDDIIMLHIGDQPKAGSTGIDAGRSIGVKWADLESAWQLVRDHRLNAPKAD